MDYKIEKKDAFDVIGFKRRMTEENNAHFHAIGQFWGDFHCQKRWETLNKYNKHPNGNDSNGTSPTACYAYAVTQQDYSDDVRKDSFYYAIGVVYNDRDYSEDSNKYSDELEIIHIPASTYAIFVMPPNDEVGAFTGRIFQEWLPSSGYQLAGSPELELSSSQTDALFGSRLKSRRRMA